MRSELQRIESSEVLDTTSEMAERVRQFDWSKTPLGPADTWSPALRMMVCLLLTNRSPLLLWWGPEYISISNDACRVALGTRHPWALGRPASECRSEIWHSLQPRIDASFCGGPATSDHDVLLEINRQGFVEETHFKIACSPVPDESVPSGIGGVLATVHEITHKIISERRINVLRELGARAHAHRTVEQSCRLILETLGEHPRDIPFALLYLINPDGRHARLAGSAGFDERHAAGPAIVDLEQSGAQLWPLTNALRTQQMQVIDIRTLQPDAAIPPGPWDDPPREAVLIPIRSSGHHPPAGVLVAGVSARLKFDQHYRTFFELIAGQIAAVVADARMFEAECKQAQTLAEPDREKAANFVNFGHEFRTPLASVLGPLEDALAATTQPEQRRRLELLRHNALRLQEFVNTLLSLARTPTDAHRAVTESEERFRAFTSATSDIVYRMSPDWTEMRQLQGREFITDTLEPTRSWIDTYIAPEDQPLVLQEIQRAIKTRTIFELEHRVIRVDRSIGWTHSRAMPVLDDRGEIVEWFGAASDVTSRKAMEQVLRDSESRYRTLFESIDEGFCVFEMLYDASGRAVDYRFLEVNPAFEKHTGLVGAVGKTILELVPDLETSWFELYGQVAETGVPIRFENREQGLHRWFDVYALRLGKPEDRRVAAIFTDVTERKRAELAVRESERRFRSFADSAPAMLWVTEPDGTCSFLSRGWYEFTGQNESHALGFGWLEAVHPDDRNASAETFRRANASREPFSFEYRLRRHDGQYRWAIDAGRPRFNSSGDFLGYIGSVFDITGHKQAVQALHESETRYRALFESIDEGFCIIEFFDGPHGPLSDYIHIEANPAYTANAGIPDIVGQTVRAMVPDEADDWVEIYRNVLLTGKPVRFERELIATGRHLDLAAFRVGPLERRQVAVLFKDVSERKRAEETLKEADRKKDEFLATLAHELRNPLAPIRNAVQVLRLKGSDEPESRWSREVIERQVEHLTHLIDDLLDISRITRNKLELRKQRVALADVIHGAVESSRPLIQQWGHELTVSLPPEPVYLHGDLVRLAQVFLNLLNNAAKYTERGGRIWLSAERQGDEAVIRVKDTGVGIPRDKLSGLFELFFQVDGTLERSQGGLGIGLSLVRRLVELHGGEVEAFSKGLGHGSEFTVRLPVLVEPKSERNGPDTDRLAHQPPKSSRRLLVVDDNRDAADTLSTFLRLLGNEVQTAYDGQQGIEVAERFLPEAILLDIGMPRLNGYDACRRIREQTWGRKMVVIALTGWGQDEDRRRTEEVGFDGHLVKPVDLTALSTVLAEKLGSRAPT